MVRDRLTIVDTLFCDLTQTLAAGGVFEKLHRVALPGYAQPRRGDGQPPDGQPVPAALPEFLVVDALVHEMAVHGAVIFGPLILNVDQRPLVAAEGEVL